MRLVSVELQNYRCYKKICFEFQPGLTLITGGNDTGKSALMEGIQALVTGRGIDRDDFRQSVKDDEPINTLIIEGVVEEAGEEVYYRRKWELDEEGIRGGSLEQLKEIPQDADLQSAFTGWGKQPWLKDQQLELLERYQIQPAGKADDRLQQLCTVIEAAPKNSDWVELNARAGLEIEVEFHSHENASDDPIRDIEKHLKSHLSAVFKSESQRGSFENVKRRLERQARSGVTQISRIFAKYDGQHGNAEAMKPIIEVDLARGFSLEDISFRQGNTYRRMAKMGAAKRRKLQLALLEWRRQVTERVETSRPLLLLYDEPDTHFDYAGQRRMFKLLRDIADQDRIQVIVVTHSLNLIDRVDLYRIAYLDRQYDADEPITIVQQPQEWGEIVDIAKALGLRNHVILNACLLFMEGPTEHTLIPGLFELDRDYSLRSIGVEVLEDSSGNAHAWSLCKHALKLRRRAFLILDRDTAKNGTVTRNAIRSFNRQFDLPQIKEGENLFYFGMMELEDVFPQVALVEALRRHAAAEFSNIDARPPSTAALRRAVRAALCTVDRRGRPIAYTKALEEALSEELAANKQFNLSKPQIGSHLLNVYRESQKRIPQEIRKGFDALEQFVEVYAAY